MTTNLSEQKDDWKGPEFSCKPNHEWPRQGDVEVYESDHEVRITVTTNLVTVGTDKVTT